MILPTRHGLPSGPFLGRSVLRADAFLAYQLLFPSALLPFPRFSVPPLSSALSAPSAFSFSSSRSPLLFAHSVLRRLCGEASRSFDVRRLSSPHSSLLSSLPPRPSALLWFLRVLFASSAFALFESFEFTPLFTAHNSRLPLPLVSTRLQPRWCAPKCPSFVALSGFSKKIFARVLTARNSLPGLDFHHGLAPIAPRLVTAHHRLCAHQSVRPPPVWRTPSATRRPPNRVGQLVSDHHPDGPERHRPAGTKRTPASAACAKDTPCAVVGVATRQPPSAARVTPRSPWRVVTPSSPPTHNPGCETTAITRAASPRALGRRHRGGMRNKAARALATCSPA